MTKDGKYPAQAEISRRLKMFYDSVQDEQIPDKFLDLLEKLDQAEKTSQERRPAK